MADPDNSLSRDRRIYGPVYRSLREPVLSRDGNRCRTCNEDGTKYGLQTHHRYYPRDDAGNTMDHLTTLCTQCHDVITDHQRRERDEGSRGTTREEQETRDQRPLVMKTPSIEVVVEERPRSTARPQIKQSIRVDILEES